MKNLIITIIIITSLCNFCNGQVQIKSLEKDSIFIKVFVNKKGDIFLDHEKTTLSELEKYLKLTKLEKAKLATIFPTPIKVFATVEKVNTLFEKFNMKPEWYQDSDFTIPAWE